MKLPQSNWQLILTHASRSALCQHHQVQQKLLAHSHHKQRSLWGTCNERRLTISTDKKKKKICIQHLLSNACNFPFPTLLAVTNQRGRPFYCLTITSTARNVIPGRTLDNIIDSFCAFKQSNLHGIKKQSSSIIRSMEMNVKEKTEESSRLM